MSCYVGFKDKYNEMYDDNNKKEVITSKLGVQISKIRNLKDGKYYLVKSYTAKIKFEDVLEDFVDVFRYINPLANNCKSLLKVHNIFGWTSEQTFFDKNEKIVEKYMNLRIIVDLCDNDMETIIENKREEKKR